MANGTWLLLAIISVYAGALGAGPLLRQRGVVAAATIVIAVPAILSAPLLIPAEAIILRAASAWFSTDLAFRLVDYYRHLRHPDERTDFRAYCCFLLPFPVLLVVFADHRRRKPAYHVAWMDVVGMLAGAMGVATGFLLLKLLAPLSILQNSFLLDHLAKVAVFLLTIESASRFLHGLERLTGYDIQPFVDNVVLARTVADFWQRYNTRVHRWLYENVFRPGGGRRAPVRGVVLVFLVSALLHELMFGIATSRFDGYQLIFFLLQIPPVLASRFLERLANRGGIAGKALAHGLTIVWMVGSSVFFFHGVNKVFPFVYVSESWLP